MSKPTSANEGHRLLPGTSAAATGAALVDARLTGTRLDTYPGVVPTSLEAAYAVQDAAIADWPDDVAGWKIGFIAPERRGRDEADRFIGPIWKRNVRASTSAEPIEVFEGAVVEAEYVLQLAEDLPPGLQVWTADTAGQVRWTVCGGIEVCGSPVRHLIELGPHALAADFGFNLGAVVSHQFGVLNELSLDDLQVSTIVNGRAVGDGSVANVPGGLLAAAAAALNTLNTRGLTLKRGQVLLTGALTGGHPIDIGATVEVRFGGTGALKFRSEAWKGQKLATRSPDWTTSDTSLESAP